MERQAPSPSLPACSAKDKALLLPLVLKWRKESKTSSLTAEQIQECEREIWVEHIRAAMEVSNVSTVHDLSSYLCVHVKLHFRQPYY